MNPTQLQGTLAPLVSFLAGLAAGKGLFGLDAGAWTTLLGALFGLGATIWGIVATRKSAIISTTAGLADVKNVTLMPNADPALVQSTPSNVTK